MAAVDLDGGKVLVRASAGVPLITRHQLGAGAVIVTLAPRMLGLDERAHPALPYLMNAVTAGLLPVEVRLAGGLRPQGEILYQINQTADGYLVSLINNRGVDKTQSGVARVDRRATANVLLRTAVQINSATDYTEPRELSPSRQAGATEISLSVHPGDVKVVHLKVN